MKRTAEPPKESEVVPIGGDTVVTEQQRQQMFQVFNESIDCFFENDREDEPEPEKAQE